MWSVPLRCQMGWTKTQDTAQLGETYSQESFLEHKLKRDSGDF